MEREEREWPRNIVKGKYREKGRKIKFQSDRGIGTYKERQIERGWNVLKKIKKIYS